MRRICCPLECGSLQVVAATRHTRSSIIRFIDRARVGDAGRRAGGGGGRHARTRRRTRVGEGGLELALGVALGLGEILVIDRSNDSSALVLADSRMQIVDVDITMRMGCMIFQPFYVRRISIY